MKFHTLNSTYEVDKSKKLIRRLVGAKAPTKSIGADGEWRPYLDIILLQVGFPAIFAWNEEKGLQTSNVTAIEPDPMLQDLLDWDRINAAPTFAGGHTEVMDVLFKGAEVIASWVEDDYQGNEAYAYRLPDGRYVALTDSFGSCSGCDAWEDASRDDVRSMCIELANNAHVFDRLDELIAFIEGDVPADKAAYFHERDLSHLLDDLKRVRDRSVHPDLQPYATAL